jgi:hypothetical protein
MAALGFNEASDPSQIPTPVPPFPVNPLELLSDADLETARFQLTLGCGRNHNVLRKAKRSHLCFMAFLLQIEQLRRKQAG